MLGAQPCVCSISVSGAVTTSDQSITRSSIPNYLRSYPPFRREFRHRQCCKLKLGVRPINYCNTSKSISITCNSSSGSPGYASNGGEENNDDYIQAVVLISETIKHHRMRMQGFQEDMGSRQLFPFSGHRKDPMSEVNMIGQGLLRRFQSPTIFLKISCNGDFLLPIIVGEYAVEKLIDSLHEDDRGDCLNHFELVRNLVSNLGYEVKMIRITERVVNTYFARIYLHKPGEKNVFSVDARPSDAINVAERCRAPIYVNKQIVLNDAVRIAYGMGRGHDAKSVYDVSLDSASEGPDFLAEELDLVRDMNLAVEEERYTDAAMLRDKLTKLRQPKHDH